MKQKIERKYYDGFKARVERYCLIISVTGLNLTLPILNSDFFYLKTI